MLFKVKAEFVIEAKSLDEAKTGVKYARVHADFCPGHMGEYKLSEPEAVEEPSKLEGKS